MYYVVHAGGVENFDTEEETIVEVSRLLYQEDCELRDITVITGTEWDVSKTVVLQVKEY